MNRRNFIRNIVGVVAAFSVLPAATTYNRTWTRTRQELWVPNPEYVEAPYEVAIIYGPNAFETINVGPPPKEFLKNKFNTFKEAAQKGLSVRIDIFGRIVHPYIKKVIYA
jgi:hypothetical protein